jgi:glycosyltransferase involved in cell wall biosynthesis
VYWLRRGELLNFVGCPEDASWDEESWNQRRPWQELKRAYAGWHPKIQAIIDAADHDLCYRWSLFDRKPIDNWSTERVTLLGFLSDPAVRHFLRRAHLFVAFFPEGVRANNTSVLAAMAAGRPALTDLDAFSPPWMRHGVNVLDLARTMPEDLSPATLRLLGERARADAEEQAGWAALAERLAAEAVAAQEGGREAAAPGTC